MASVVALSVNGTAIGTLSNPDGSYRIDGIPPGDYYVYTQPLPPPQQDENAPAAIYPPSDSAGGSFDAFTGFAGQFFPHTRDWQQATTTTVTAGASAGNVNFDVEARTGPSIYNLDILAYLGPAGKEAYVHAPSLVSGYRGWMVFDAPGTLVPNTTKLTPGMSLSAIGPAAKLEPDTLGLLRLGLPLQRRGRQSGLAAYAGGSGGHHRRRSVRPAVRPLRSCPRPGRRSVPSPDPPTRWATPR